MEKIEKIKPSGIFKNFIYKAIPLAFDESLSYYEMLCNLLQKVKTIEEVVNNHADVIKELEEFVVHYFDNLDVQEEIDNKLDEMAESGVLAEIINEQLFDDLSDEIHYTKINQLVDNVQLIYKTNFSSIFGAGWGVSGAYLKDIAGNTKGLVIANDYTPQNPTYIERFNIRVFDYNNNTITNISETAVGLLGHANCIADIGNNKVLICGTPNFYIYDLVNDTYTYIANPVNSGWISMIANDEEGNVYGCQDYDYDTSTVINRFYTFDIDNVNDTLSIASFKEIPDLKERIQKNEQGMVIYNGLLIYPSFSTNKLCIYDFKSFDYIKTQELVAPYESEIEDGFVYNDTLYLLDANGRLYTPDLYGREVIGDYVTNNIARSNTEICLLDEPVKIQSGEYVDLNFSKYLNFMNLNTDANIGTFGAKLESITIYVAVRTYDGSNGIHNLTPIEIPLYKNIEYGAETINWLSYHWQTYFTQLNGSVIQRNTYYGTYSFRGSATIPQLRFSFESKYLEEHFDTTDNTSTWSTMPEGYPASIYITKIIGHKKVGLKY